MRVGSAPVWHGRRAVVDRSSGQDLWRARARGLRECGRELWLGGGFVPRPCAAARSAGSAREDLQERLHRGAVRDVGQALGPKAAQGVRIVEDLGAALKIDRVLVAGVCEPRGRGSPRHRTSRSASGGGSPRNHGFCRRAQSRQASVSPHRAIVSSQARTVPSQWPSARARRAAPCRAGT